MVETDYQWMHEFPSAITVCDANGKILYMNKKSQKTFEKYGGEKLIDKNVLDYHPEPARSKLKNMLEQGLSNSYTIEKNGIKKIIHQSPWYDDGIYKGFVEISIQIPMDMPHHIRK
jgi:PAS domain S-box-containing protein